ncbi:hypothetical protein C8J56DRAFT_952234 [Mycena floridula]|nr:hypothetical protein C8J56DRAFT_952234 [Mycena floridula]
MSDTISIERVTSFQDPRTKQALVILNTLFEDMTAFLDGKEELCSMFFDITVKATLLAGQFIVAVNKTSGKVVGTVSFFPPGTDIFSDERQRQESGLEDFYTALSPAFSSWWRNIYFPAIFKDASIFLGPEAKVKNWNLYSLAVSESHWNRGIGTTLMHYGEDQAALSGHAMILEASGEPNLTIYPKLGYKNLGPVDVEGPPGMSNFSHNIFVKYPKL